MKIYKATVIGIILLTGLWGCERDAEIIETPLEAAGYEFWTKHSEVVEFSELLDAQTDIITTQQLGYSEQKRDIYYFKVSENEQFSSDDNKLTALIFGQQHGDEPSGNDALLKILRDIATGEHQQILEYMDLLIVPQVNPDGAEILERRNAEDVDLNRSHLILDGKETRPLRDLFHRWKPEVTLDVHQYQPWVDSWIDHGFIRLFDEQYGLPTNVNTAEDIRDLAEGPFLDYIAEHLDQEGFTFHNYLIGDPESIRYSTTNINDGRQGFAIMNTFSLILEGRRARGDQENIRHRKAGQVAAIEGLLQFSVDHKEEIASAVQESRRDITDGRINEFILTMKREQTGEPLTIPVLEVYETEDDDYAKGDTIEVDIDNYNPLVTPARTTEMPEGYIIPEDHSEIAELLFDHQVEYRELEGGENLQAEVFRIEDFTEEEFESPTMIPVGETRSVNYEASPGDIFIPTAQLRGLMIATALEAQSMHGLIQYDEFENLKQEGDFPVLRVTSEL